MVKMMNAVASMIKVENEILDAGTIGKAPGLFINIGEVFLSDDSVLWGGQMSVNPLSLLRSWDLKRQGFRMVGTHEEEEISKGTISSDLAVEAAQELNIMCGGLFDVIYICPHRPHAGEAVCQCRKPRPGMGRRAASEYNLELDKSLVIGLERDKLFAEAIGAAFQTTASFMEDCPKNEAGELDRDRAEGTLFGLACGDSLGSNLEFLSPVKIQAKYGRVTEMIEGGWARGEPTDDTELSLIWMKHFEERGDGISSHSRQDLTAKLQAWQNKGPKDIGLQTASAISGSHKKPMIISARSTWISRDRQAAGNGALMRCAPVAVNYWNRPDLRLAATLINSAMTNVDPRSLWACVALNEAVAACLRGEKDPYATACRGIKGTDKRVEDALAEAKDFDLLSADLMTHMGYVLLGLKVAFAATFQTKGFEESLIDVVNRGGDADTNGTIAGALLGAYFGKKNIPHRWFSALEAKEEIKNFMNTMD
ncbi:MAG: ADP-ribosylglycohydrolase family protein [bacterium]